MACKDSFEKKYIKLGESREAGKINLSQRMEEGIIVNISYVYVWSIFGISLIANLNKCKKCDKLLCLWRNKSLEFLILKLENTILQ